MYIHAILFVCKLCHISSRHNPTYNFLHIHNILCIIRQDCALDTKLCTHIHNNLQITNYIDTQLTGWGRECRNSCLLRWWTLWEWSAWTRSRGSWCWGPVPLGELPPFWPGWGSGDIGSKGSRDGGFSQFIIEVQKVADEWAPLTCMWFRWEVSMERDWTHKLAQAELISI